MASMTVTHPLRLTCVGLNLKFNNRSLYGHEVGQVCTALVTSNTRYKVAVKDKHFEIHESKIGIYK